MSTDEITDGETSARQGPIAIEESLQSRGHVVTSWDELEGLKLPSNKDAPTVFKMWFPPGCTDEITGRFEKT